MPLSIAYYIVHGTLMVPYYQQVNAHLNAQTWTFFILGGAIFIIGAIFFGSHKPVLNPEVFGFHEVWHVNTVLANFMFMIPIVGRALPPELSFFP
jgi:hemolysin III